MHQQMDAATARLFLFGLPFAFAAMWLLVTSLLGAISGWFDLQTRFPRGDAPALFTLRGCSGSMGIGVSLSKILTLSACAPGLRVGIWRIFGPFQRPFLVPWGEIRAEPRTMLFYPMVKLRFGNPQAGVLTIDARAWERLVAVAGPANHALHLPPVGDDRVRFVLLLQWAVITTLAATFFAVASRTVSAPGSPGLPLVTCIAFPAAVFGLAQFIRYLRAR